jgi:alpha-tubulin suppressor-like RCC1 family protein
LQADGRVVAVGYNEEGQCEVSDWRGIVAIAAGERYTIGIKSDGSVVAVGQNSCGQCDLWDWNLAVKPFTQNIISSETIVNKQDIPANATSNQSAFGTNQSFLRIFP